MQQQQPNNMVMSNQQFQQGQGFPQQNQFYQQQPMINNPGQNNIMMSNHQPQQNMPMSPTTQQMNQHQVMMSSPNMANMQSNAQHNPQTMMPNQPVNQQMLQPDPGNPYDMPPTQVELFRSIKAFSAADLHHDVQITAPEFAYFSKSKLPPQITTQLIAVCDKDKDGILSPSEFVLCLILHMRVRTTNIFPTPQQIQQLYIIVEQECQLNQSQFPEYAQGRLFAPLHLPQQLPQQPNATQGWADDFDAILQGGAPHQPPQQQQHANLAQMTGQHSQYNNNLNTTGLARMTGHNSIQSNPQQSNLARMTGQSNFPAAQQPPSQSNSLSRMTGVSSQQLQDQQGSSLAQMTGVRGRRTNAHLSVNTDVSGAHTAVQPPMTTSASNQPLFTPSNQQKQGQNQFFDFNVTTPQPQPTFSNQQQQQLLQRPLSTTNAAHQAQLQQQQPQQKQQATFDMFESLALSSTSNNSNQQQQQQQHQQQQQQHQQHQQQLQFEQQQQQQLQLQQQTQQQHLHQLQQQTLQIQQQISELEFTNVQAKQQYDQEQEEILRLQEQLAQDQATLAELASERSQLDDKHMGLAITAGEVKDNHGQVSYQLQQLQHEIFTLRSNIQRFESEQERLESEFEQAQVDVNTAHVDRDELLTSVTALESNYHAKIAENQALHQQVVELKQEIADLSAKQEFFSREITMMDDFEGEVSKLQSEQSVQLDAFTTLKAVYDAKLHHNRQLQQQQTQLFAEIEQLRISQAQLNEEIIAIDKKHQHDQALLSQSYKDYELLVNMLQTHHSRLDTVVNAKTQSDPKYDTKTLDMARNFLQLAAQLLQAEGSLETEQAQAPPVPTPMLAAAIASAAAPIARPASSTSTHSTHDATSRQVPIVAEIVEQPVATIVDPQQQSQPTEEQQPVAEDNKHDGPQVEQPIAAPAKPAVVIDDTDFNAFDDAFDAPVHQANNHDDNAFDAAFDDAALEPAIIIQSPVPQEPLQSNADATPQPNDDSQQAANTDDAWAAFDF